MIIALAGFAKSGKDTVAGIIQEVTAGNVYEMVGDKLVHRYALPSPWQIKKFSAKLKQVASILTGIPAEEFEKQEVKDSNLPSMWDREYLNFDEDLMLVSYPVREFLQDLGTNAVRDVMHDNAWVNALMSEYRPDCINQTIYCSEDQDVRCHKGFSYGCYPNWIITDCRFPNEAEAVKERGGIVVRVVRPGVGPVNAHPSETALDDWKFDRYISNARDVISLKEQVKLFLYEAGIKTNEAGTTASTREGFGVSDGSIGGTTNNKAE